MRLERLRRLWTQCDLFDAPVIAPVTASAVTRPESQPPSQLPSQPLSRKPSRSKKRANGRAVRKKPRTQHTHRDDVEFVELLMKAHAQYNAALFGGTLKDVRIRISRRMKNRLGHYMADGSGFEAEIAMSRKHIEHDVWDDVLHTFVHEMVHQWQDENGHALDHGLSFRRKAREIGISARATRPAASSSQPRLAARAMHRPKS